MAASENGWSLVGESSLQPLPGLPSNARLLAGPVATVLGYVAGQFDARVEKITSTSTYRANATIGSSSVYSNHASGTAIDMNGGKHPQGSHGTFTAAQVATLRAILAECGGVLRWGGDYTTTVDEMHVEIRPGATADQVATAAAALTGTTPTQPDPSGGTDMFVITYNGVPYSVTPLSLKPCSSVYAAVWSSVTGRALVGVDANGFTAVRDQVAAHIVDTGTNLKGQGL